MNDKKEVDIEQHTEVVAKLLTGILFVFLNGLLIYVSWNTTLITLFPSILRITYIQACTLGILGKALFAPLRVP